SRASLAERRRRMANDILVKIGADITDFSRKMAESNKALRNFGKANTETFGAFKQVGGALTKYVTAPAAAAVTALTGITLVKGFQRLVGIDTARAKLSALGHDAESVEDIMNNALDSVRGTSFGMDEAATAAASAVAAGIKPGKELTKYLTTMGDAAAIAGTDFNEMASIFNKVETAQRAYTGDLNQLADRGISIYQWLAEEAGSTAEAVREMASKGEVSSEMFKAAIEKNIGGAAKEIGEKSLMAALKNIGADIGRIGANFLDAGGEGEGFFSRLKPLLTEFRGFLQSLEKPAAELGKKFGDAFIKVIEGVKSAVNWFRELSPTIQKVVGFFTAFVAVVTVAAGPILLFIGFIPQLISGFAALKTVALAIGGALGSISAPVIIVIALIRALIAAVVYAYRESEAFRDAISTAFNAIKDVVMSVIGAVVDFIQEVWGFIVGWWEENNETIMSVANKAWDGISNAITSVMEYLVPFLEGVWLGIQTVVQVVWEFIKTVV